jgi:peroxidase
MAASANSFLGLLLLLVALASSASAQLSPTFYDTSCPNALSTIRTAVNAAVAREARMGASLLRMHFHDCFVQASFAACINLNHLLQSISLLLQLASCSHTLVCTSNS